MSVYRCSKCRARQRPTSARAETKCQSCGVAFHKHWERGQAHLTLDRYRTRKERGRSAPKCRCRGYSFDHRPGGGFCIHNPRLTDEALQAREAAGAWA